jgi:hypothetical protein
MTEKILSGKFVPRRILRQILGETAQDASAEAAEVGGVDADHPDFAGLDHGLPVRRSGALVSASCSSKSAAAPAPPS